MYPERLSVTTYGRRTFKQLLDDHLSKTCRAERKVLLAAGAIGIVIAKTGLVPARITALGIEFSSADQNLFLRMFAWAVSYFLIAFIIYAISDVLSWRLSFVEDYLDDFARRLDVMKSELREQLDRPPTKHELREYAKQRDARERLLVTPDVLETDIEDKTSTQVLYISSLVVAFVRLLFEFVLPVIIGLAAIVVLVRTPSPQTTGKQPSANTIQKMRQEIPGQVERSQ